MPGAVSIDENGEGGGEKTTPCKMCNQKRNSGEIRGIMEIAMSKERGRQRAPLLIGRNSETRSVGRKAGKTLLAKETRHKNQFRDKREDMDPGGKRSYSAWILTRLREGGLGKPLQPKLSGNAGGFKKDSHFEKCELLVGAS